MIKKLQLIVFVMFLSGSIFAQTTWTVDNKPGAPADFSDLQAAIDSVTPGDILLVQGSPIHYGYGITLSKKLTMRGPGYYLDQNPNTQVYYEDAEIKLSINPGAEGSIVSGFKFYYPYSGYVGLSINECDNIILSNNYVTHTALISSSNNIMINSSFITISIEGNSSDIVYKGCYGNVYPDNFANAVAVTLINNVMITAVTGTTAYNNIIRGSTPILGDPKIHHNVFTSGDSTWNGNNNNIYEINYNDIFIDNADPRYSSDGQYILKSGSPAIGAGTGGTDCGMFGGSSPYKLSGIPGIPNIYELNVPENGYTNDGINVEIKVKSNN